MKIQQKRPDALQMSEQQQSASEKSGMKGQLRGMGYDAAVQMLTPQENKPTGDAYECVRRAARAVGAAAGALQNDLAALQWTKKGIHPKSQAAAADALTRFTSSALAGIDACNFEATDQQKRLNPDIEKALAMLANLRANVAQGIVLDGSITSPGRTVALVLMRCEMPSEFNWPDGGLAAFEAGCSSVAPITQGQTKEEAADTKNGPGRKGPGRIDMRH